MSSFRRPPPPESGAPLGPVSPDEQLAENPATDRIDGAGVDPMKVADAIIKRAMRLHRRRTRR